MHRELARTHTGPGRRFFRSLPGSLVIAMKAIMSSFATITLLSLQGLPHHPHPRHPAPVGTNNDPQLTLCPGRPRVNGALFRLTPRNPAGPGASLPPPQDLQGAQCGGAATLAWLRNPPLPAAESGQKQPEELQRRGGGKKKGNTQFVVFSWGLFSCQKNYPLCLCAKEAVRAPSAGRRHGANTPCLRAASVPFLASPDIFLTYKTLYLIGYRSPFS